MLPFPALLLLEPREPPRDQPLPPRDDPRENALVYSGVSVAPPTPFVRTPGTSPWLRLSYTLETGEGSSGVETA